MIILRLICILILLSFFYAIPIASLIFFILSLYWFLSVRRKNKLEPGSIDAQTLKNKKIIFILASVIFGIMVAIVIALIVLISMSVSFM